MGRSDCLQQVWHRHSHTLAVRLILIQMILRFCPFHFALINSRREGSRQNGTIIR